MWKYYQSLIRSLEDVGYSFIYSSCDDKYFSTYFRLRDRVASVIISFEAKRVSFSVNSVLKEVRKF